MVSRLTGISQHVLRVWERRHGAVTAHRSENGRRLYSQRDVDRLLLLKHLVDRGDTIGQLAHLDDEQLRERGQAVRQSTEAREQLASDSVVRVAVLGEYLPAQIMQHEALPDRIRILTRATSVSAFRADVRRLRPDALLIEQAIVNAEVVELVRDLANESGAHRVVVAYAFGRQSDVQPLRDLGARPVRSPASLDEIFSALLDPVRRDEDRRREEPVSEPSPIEATDTSIPPRRFQPSELARLASASTTVECECPKHLVDLVMSLSAFEAYSAACESSCPDDAALHAYLHATTAQARSRIEEALARVAEADGLMEGS